MTNLILDLTGNGGGILQTATDITDEFLEKGKLIVYTEGKNQPRYSINSTDKGNFKKGNLVVLVDEGSASASEILSGAVQDWDRGVIVGRRTFGKGLVQRQLPLPDGTMIRLTVARYYTPTGRSIQKPYENGDLDSYNMDVLNRYNRGELIHADSIHFPDSLKYKTLVNKRTVYGGGGIMPDYFVPIDTTTLTNLHRDLIAKGVVNRISISEVDKNRNALLANYPDVEIFKKKYEITPEMVDNLKQMALSDSIKWDDEQFERSRDFLFTQLKALIARDLYNSSAYFRIMNDENEIFKEAFRIINNEKRYNSLLKGLGDKVSNPNS
jgi:carboxyl-terminal processing protease